MTEKRNKAFLICAKMLYLTGADIESFLFYMEENAYKKRYRRENKTWKTMFAWQQDLFQKDS